MWRPIEALDNKVGADVQTTMLLDVNKLLDRGTVWFLRNASSEEDLEQTVARFVDGVTTLSECLYDVLQSPCRPRCREDRLILL